MTDDWQSIADLHLLDPAAACFRREGCRLQLRQAGEEGEEEQWVEVTVVRLFPLSTPEQWLSVQNAEGKEVGILADLHGLTRENRELLEEELRRRYLVPQILRILHCRERFDLVEWTVETDRGEITFRMRHLQENIKQPLPRRLTLTDVEGNRFDIHDVTTLDPASRKMLEEHM